MLSEEEVKERAEYCTCVLLQLGWLLSNPSIHPGQYLDYLKESSLDLANDTFITMTLEEGLLTHREDGGLGAVVSLYEGFVYALCEVLETDMETVRKQIAPNFLKELAQEMGI